MTKHCLVQQRDERLLCLEGVNDGWLGDGHLYYGLPENAEVHQVCKIPGTHSNVGLPCPLHRGSVVRLLHIFDECRNGYRSCESSAPSRRAEGALSYSLA